MSATASKQGEMVKPVSFDDTSIAFGNRSEKDLRFSHRIFSLMKYPVLVNALARLTVIALALRLPVKWAVKATIFRQFCGGESIRESLPAVEKLYNGGIHSILDYSVEGKERDEDFDHTKDEVLRIIGIAKNDPRIPCTVIKVTGIAPFDLLHKMAKEQALDREEEAQKKRVWARLEELCAAAFRADVQLYIDAEESWIQPAIDRMAEVMMERYNREKAVIFTTIQLYRHDRLAYFSRLIETAREKDYHPGAKLVRGAYLEKENERAAELGYPSPMQPDKASTDSDYNKALELSIRNIDIVELCAGTHNEQSCLYLTELMQRYDLPDNDCRIWFSQLYGMSDHISFTLAACGYNVSKYLPYGPVRATIPYLTRRARENRSIAGQMGKELQMVVSELKRRKGRG